MKRRLQELLSRPRALHWIVALAALLTLPSLGAGLTLDDHMHRTMLDGGPFARAPHDLYAFMPDDEQFRRMGREMGGLPWYADRKLRASLWRPLASLSITMDYHLWRHVVPLAHLQSVLWYAALALAVGLLFRRLIATPWVAALAALLYAVDEAHGFPVGWIANRNAVMAMTFGALSLLCYVRWRQEDGPWWRALQAPALLVVGLLCGEAALAVTAYMFAHAVFMQRGPLVRRLASLVPCALACVAWRVVYVSLGHSFGGSSLYIDPTSEPLAFLQAAPARVAVLLQGQLTPLTSEIYSMALGRPWTAFALVAAATNGLALFVLWRWLRGNPTAQFWLCGMVLSVLPSCATFAHDRLLFPVGIGAFGLMAQWLAGPSEAPAGLPESYWRRLPVRALAGCWILFHLVLAPLQMPIKSLAPLFIGKAFEQAARSLDRVEPRAEVNLIYVNAPGFFQSAWCPLIRAQLGLAAPNKVRVLGSTLGRVEVTRPDRRTLRLRALEGGGFGSGMMDSLMYAAEAPFTAGQQHRLSDVTITLGPLNARGRPRELTCRFTGYLDRLGYTWTAWHHDGYRRFPLPRPGQTVFLEPTTINHMLELAFSGEPFKP